jgi:hypothetical protein
VNTRIHGEALITPIEYRKGIRAYAVRGFGGGQGEVHLSERNDAAVFVHEFGHQIEYANEEAFTLVNDFLNSRVGSEEPVTLQEKFPEAGYKDHERGRKDDFEKTWRTADPTGNAENAAYYTGKLNGRDSTEILSMGIQMLYEDATAFAEADSEFFDLIVGITTGRVLQKSRVRY